MDLYEEIELYNDAMENAYLIITKKLSLDDMCDLIDNNHEFPLPFNPLDTLGLIPEVIDIVIEYYIGIEEYEKCAKIKDLSKSNEIVNWIKLPFNFPK